MEPNQFIIASPDDFCNWKTINDTIMGGSSQGRCEVKSKGLCFEGNVVEKDGGFVSCLSPIFTSYFDLSTYKGIQIDLDGQGRTLKLAISCADNITRFSQFFSGGVKWVAEVKTNSDGNTSVKIPFDMFLPTIRAKPVFFPVSIDLSSICQFQLLHSKFGISGKPNIDFKPGPFTIIIHSLSAYS